MNTDSNTDSPAIVSDTMVTWAATLLAY